MTRGEDCCLTNGNDRNGGCRTPRPRWEEDLVDRTTGVHRKSHSASREQPQSRKTGKSIRRNIRMIRTIPCVQIVWSRGHSCYVPTRYFEAFLTALRVLAMRRHTAHSTTCRKGPLHRRAGRADKMWFLRSVRHTAFHKDDKGRRASAEGIWSPPLNKASTSGNFPRRAGNGGAQRSGSGP